MANNPLHLLVVDDDKLIGAAIKLCLPAGWKCTYVSNPNLIPYDQFYHAAFVDMHLSGDLKSAEGPAIISKLVQAQPQLDVVAMSGNMDRNLMEKVLKVGAQKFLAKPLMNEEIQMTLEKIEAYWNLRTLDSQRHADQIHWIGTSSVSQNIKKQIASLRGEANHILIEGETGAGKDVTATLLNAQEGSRPFISVNVAAIPDALFESEFFGHIKGAFTGAEQNKIGLVEAANGGDLFLDEVEALPLHHQVKLLRFIESGEFKKVGSNQNQKTIVRILAASNQPLKKMIAENQFREDLYFRLSSHRIELPPLRSRSEDIAELADFFLERVRPKRNKKFTEEALAALKTYHWPGNVRELKRICEQLSLTSPLPLIRDIDVLSLISPSTKSFANLETLDLTPGLATILENYEKHVLSAAVSQYQNIESVADILKISRSSLYKKLKDYNLQGV